SSRPHPQADKRDMRRSRAGACGSARTGGDLMTRLLAALLIAASSLTSGCFWAYGQFDWTGSGTTFDESQQRFMQLVRWGEWDMASALVADEDRDHFLDVMQHLHDIKFTDWENLMIDMGDGFKTAEVVVRLEGYRETTLMHYQGDLKQEWVRLEGV